MKIRLTLQSVFGANQHCVYRLEMNWPIVIGYLNTVFRPVGKNSNNFPSSCVKVCVGKKVI